MREKIRSLINRTGYDVVKTRNQHNSLEQHIDRIFAKYAIDCVIDVGANAGQYGKLLRETGFQGWIVSFEPVKSVFESLDKTSASDNKWLCYNAALGQENEYKEMNVYESTVFSSFLDANSYSKNIWKSLNNSAKETVNVVTLDQIFEELESRTRCHNFYLKLDTQGYDRSVLQGSTKCLAKIKSLQMELSLIHIYDKMIDPYLLLQELRDNNYLVSGMYPINRDENLAVIEFDCVLVKNTARHQ